MDLPEPTAPRADRREVLLEYLDYYRDAVRGKVTGLGEAELRASRLPSGWSPIELVSHLVHVERRWVVWGFEGRPVEDPWGDTDPVTDRWSVPPDVGVEDLLDRLDAGGRHTRAVVMAHALDDVGQPGERWEGADPATLERVLLHLLQELARHTGHLDVVRELVDGRVGEGS